MPTKNNPSLSDLQQWMRWVLTHPDGVPAALQRTHPLGACVNVIGQTSAVNRETRLSIYGDGYFARIVDVLGANFSSVKNVMGAHAFNQMARAYLIKHPSTFKSIDDIGGQLSDFLKRHFSSKRQPFLSDLARVEWSAHRAFFADDVPPIDQKKIANVPEKKWTNARFTLDPSVRLERVSWPADRLWRTDGEMNTRGLKKGKIHLVVFRNTEKNVRVFQLTAEQFALLDSLQKGMPLGKALAAMNKELPVAAWFNAWMTEGVVKKIDFRP